MQHVGTGPATYGLDNHGILEARTVHWNLPVPELHEEALRRGEGNLAAGGPFVVLTGQHTGRSANDKFVLREPGSENEIWWGEVNRPIEQAQVEALRGIVLEHLKG
ncbi:MAG: phosphoenolpyruvate carboxykinase (ATP), partial [Alphaproteobacteria bacterium]|nr:phosphoenolpyruvate carboxykinase (ATP) [Alphaproteobacteria bacterium]